MEIGHFVTILSSLIAVSLTLQNFFKQKWWERKEKIYSESIEKLQEIQIILFRCKMDLINIDKFHFDHEDIRYENHVMLHNRIMELLLLCDEFKLYVCKLFPYFFRPSLEKITDISNNLNKYLLYLHDYLGSDEPIDFDNIDSRNEILLSLNKANSYLSSEMQQFAFFMKLDLKINIKYFIYGYLLQIKSLWSKP